MKLFQNRHEHPELIKVFGDKFLEFVLMTAQNSSSTGLGDKKMKAKAAKAQQLKRGGGPKMNQPRSTPDQQN